MKTCTACQEEKPLESFYRNKNKPDGRAHHCKGCMTSYKNQRIAETPEAYLLTIARTRAKALGRECTITVEDIHVPEKCPILGIPLLRGVGKSLPSSPSLDRIDSTKGYAPGNVWVISKQANVMKNNATIDELENFARWVLTDMDKGFNLIGRECRACEVSKPIEQFSKAKGEYTNECKECYNARYRRYHTEKKEVA